ncbi:MAG: enoyl-CoA hydratase-related protein [Candidatus Caldarchaeum sp.]
MSDQRELIVEENEGFYTITINREEKRNAVTPGLLLDLTSEIKRIEREGKARCLIIRGAGDKAFSSGYDISAIGEQRHEMLRDYYPEHPLIRANCAIEDFPYPVIAMINGHALGAGLELAITCDIRVSAEHALFGMPPAKLGIIYPYSGIRRFLNLIGTGYVKELFLTGRTMDARRAHAIGLVNYLVAKEELEDFTKGLASEISSNAPLSMKTMKYMINSWQRNQLMSQEDEEMVKGLIIEVEESEDYREGQMAFSERRKPQFKGR